MGKKIEVKMDASGRVCIPKEIRKQLGLTYWDELPISFNIESDEITLRPEYYILCDDDDGNMVVDGEVINPERDGIKWDRELRMRVIAKSSGMDIGRIKQTTTVSLDKSGRICVPKSIRARLGLFPGFKFKADVDVHSDTITLQPLRKSGADTLKDSFIRKD